MIDRTLLGSEKNLAEFQHVFSLLPILQTMIYTEIISILNQTNYFWHFYFHFQNTQIDRDIPVAGPENMVEFQHLFSQSTRKKLSDEHIWFSVVTRPPQSRFTRLERVSCCLCLLFTSMLGNALFYERTPDGSGQNALTLGPFALTTQQVYNLQWFNWIVIELYDNM